MGELMSGNVLFKNLLECYNNNDIELFNELNSEYGLGLDSIDDVQNIEGREMLELDEDAGLQYTKNYTYSRLIADLINHEEDKHSLDLMELHVRSYSIVIFNVIGGLHVNSKLNEVLDMVDLNVSKDIAKDFLISNGLIEKGGTDNRKLRKKYKKYDLNQLKEELESHNLNTDGNRDALINRLIKFENENTYSITEYGMYRFLGVNWVAFYNTFLDYFDFDDFEYYMTENDTGDVVKNSLNYIDENIKKSYADRDFNRLHDSFSSLALISIYSKCYDDALINELKVLILRLNPIFLDKEELEDYIPLHYSNINNIDSLSTLTGVDDLKPVFSDAWDEIEFDKRMMSKEDAYEYLDEALNGNIDELNDKISFVTG